MAIESINPATGKLLRTFEPLTDQAIRDKIALASQASAVYQRVPLEHRALCMRKLAAIIEYETDDLATTITLEMGKPIRAARQEVLKCANACRYYADNAARILMPEAIQTENHSYVRWDPLGVILAVMPWNFPLWQVFRFLAPALMAGNVGLLKHSSNVPQCALLIESLVRRAGFPRGTFQALLIESRQVESVLADERIAAVTLTGSEPAGRAIAAQAGWLIKKSVLELGGSDPFIVMPSADLDEAVVAAEHGTGPHRRPGGELHRPDHHRVRVHVGLGVDDRDEVVERVNGHGVTSTSWLRRIFQVVRRHTSGTCLRIRW